MMIAYSELITVGGLGVLLVLIGIFAGISTKKGNKSCTAMTMGTVVKHSFSGEGRMAPVVDFTVNGRTYRTKKKYNGIKSLRITGVPNTVNADVWEDEKGYLCLRAGTFVNTRHLAEELWPVGSEMTVYYDPVNPKKNYVDRPISNRFISIMLIIMGLVCAAMGIMVFALMQV